MYFRYILGNSSYETIRNFVIRGVKYIYTFSVEEFKNYFGLDQIHVKKHSSGCLYFCSRINEWGIVHFDNALTDPVISLATDSDGHMLLILHNKGYIPDVVAPFHRMKSEKGSSPGNIISRSQSESSLSEYDRYVEESYMDAFEGDSDAYWNID